jgi:hypothetical protein
MSLDHSSWIMSTHYVQLLSFVNNRFRLLFVDGAMMFVTLKGCKLFCYEIGFFFWNYVGVIAYQIARQWQI